MLISKKQANKVVNYTKKKNQCQTGVTTSLTASYSHATASSTYPYGTSFLQPIIAESVKN